MPIFFLLVLFDKELLVVDHFYIWMVVLVMAIPSAIALYLRPYIWKRILPLTLVFAAFFILFYEYSALKTGQWFFLKDYIGWINLFKVKFPVEELLFALLSVPGTIGWYEFLSDGKEVQVKISPPNPSHFDQMKIRHGGKGGLVS